MQRISTFFGGPEMIRHNRDTGTDGYYLSDAGDNHLHLNLLPRWLTNDTYPLRQNRGEVMQNLNSQQTFRPARND